LSEFAKAGTDYYGLVISLKSKRFYLMFKEKGRNMFNFDGGKTAEESPEQTMIVLGVAFLLCRRFSFGS
jgi:hypothetical protein